MDIPTVSARLRTAGLELFSGRDLSLLFPGTGRGLLNLQLHQWARRGWVRRLKRGLYELAFPEPSRIPDLVVANRLCSPSYVSLDTGLSHYGVIPEFAPQVTSVTPGTTRRFANQYGVFTYFSVMPAAFRGYGLATAGGRKVLMADPEKAVVDRLYAALRRGEKTGPLVERWDRRRIRNMDGRKLRAYARLFGGYSRRLAAEIRALA
jgi:predicted transcriptional regulator of viral defense system